MLGTPISQQLDCTVKNFPVKCFYNPSKNQIYSFYRQGESLTVSPCHLENYKIAKIFDGDIGEIVLINCECLIISSSGKIKFFT